VSEFIVFKFYKVFFVFMQNNSNNNKCEVLHFDGVQRLACRAISASAELLVCGDAPSMRYRIRILFHVKTVTQIVGDCGC